MYQAEGATTSLMDAIRNVFLRPADGETKVGQACRCSCCSAVGGLRFSQHSSWLVAVGLLNAQVRSRPSLLSIFPGGAPPGGL